MGATLKRLFDISFALLLGAALAPVLLFIVIALKITSPGPILFRQKRLGKNGTTFLMNKFRKFPADWGNQGPGVTLQFDARMTGIGRILERTKLDELPQLWNILLGEMSFVGPRPESLKFRHLFNGQFEGVLAYKPGIFGPNQTKYRNESAMYPADEDPHAFYERVLFPDKARNDLAYFKNAHFLSDLWCIVSGVTALMFSMVIWRNSMKASLLLLCWDIFAVWAGWVVTHWLKYSVVSVAAIKPAVIDVFRSGFLIAPLAIIIVFTAGRIYRHPARYFSGTDFYRLVGACCVAWIVSGVTFGLTLQSVSSLLLAVACLVSIFVMVLPRIAYKEWHSMTGTVTRRASKKDHTNILVCGVTDKSIGLCNLLKHGFGVNIVGMLSDDSDQIQREVHGFKVVGRGVDLPVLDGRYSLNQIWIAGKLEPREKQIIDDWCSDNEIPLVNIDNLPGFRSLLDMPALEDSYTVPGIGLSERKPANANRQRQQNKIVA